MNKTKLATTLLFSVISTLTLAQTREFPGKVFTTLDPPNAAHTFIYGGSASGKIVGVYTAIGSNRYQSFVINVDGSYTYFGVPHAYSTDAFAVNDNGSTTGQYYLSNFGGGHEFARRGNGKILYFDPPNATRTYTQCAGINNLEQIAGDHTDSSGVTHGALIDKFGNLTLFDVPGASATFGGSINDAGQMSGTYYVTANRRVHAFVRDSVGNITAFDVPGAGTDAAQGTYPVGINASGQIGGLYSDVNYVSHGFIRNPDGTIVTFDAPDAGTGNFLGTNALAINDSGQMVGFYYDSKTVLHGFARDVDGTITEFDDPNAGTKANQGTQAYTISNSGVISGTYFDSNVNAHPHAFKLQ